MVYLSDTHAETLSIKASSPGAGDGTWQITAQAGLFTQVGMVSASTSILAHNCLPFVAQAQDQFGNPTHPPSPTVVGLTQSGAGRFSNDSQCSASTVTVSLSPDQSDALFYFIDDTSEANTLTGSAVGFGPGSLKLKVLPFGGGSLAFTAGKPALSPSECGLFTVTVENSQDQSPLNQAGAMAIGLAASPSGSFYLDSACLVSTTSTVVLANSSSASFYFRAAASPSIVLEASSPGLGPAYYGVTVGGSTGPGATQAPVNANGFAASAFSNSQINLSWGAPGGSVIGYKLAYTNGTGAPPTCSAGTDVGNLTSYSVTGLASGQQYAFLLCSYDEAGTLSRGTSASATTLAGIVSASQSSVAASPTTLPTDGTSVSTVTVTLKDALGNPVTGKTVALSSSRGNADTLTTLSNFTDGGGQVSFSVHSTTSGTTVFSATDSTDAISILQTASVSFAAGAVNASVSTLSANPSSLTADGSTSATITVTLEDGHSNPVPGKNITLSAGAGSSTIATLSGTSNSAGQATFSVKDKVAESVTYSAKDTTDSLSLAGSTTVSFIAGAVNASGSTVTASRTNLSADGNTTSSITVTLKDALGNPVAGKNVAITAGSGSSTIAVIAGTTNGSGQASFGVKDTVPESVTYTATDTTDGLTLSQTVSVTFVGSVNMANSTVSANLTNVSADGITFATITVTLKDANSMAISGKSISLTAGAGSAVITTLSGTTNGFGQAVFTVKDTVAESVTFTAKDTTDNLTLTQTASITFYAVGAVSAAQSSVTATRTSVPPDGISTAAITVTLKDVNGNAVPAKLVGVTSNRGQTDTITILSRTTDARGQASFTVQSSTLGAGVLTATDLSDALQVTQTLSIDFTRLPLAIYVADGDNNRIRVVGPPESIVTVGGSGTRGYSGDNGPATAAALNVPYGAAVDGNGNLYFSDSYNSVIRKVTPAGTITTFAGNGTQGYGGDGGPATAAALYLPKGIAVDSAGNVYIADFFNNRVRKVDASGTITTVAGNGISGYSGDGGAATSADVSGPLGVALDAAGNLYIAHFAVIRKVDPSGTITTVAGNGSSGFSGDGGLAASAQLSQPSGVAIDSQGNMYISDSGNYRIRKVDSSGKITTVAGNGTHGFTGDGGLATSAELQPMGVAVDGRGTLYIADTFNYCVRKIMPDSTIVTVAGTGSQTGYGGDRGSATSALLGAVYGIGFDGSGSLLIADSGNNRIRKLVPAITTFAGNGTAGFSGDGGAASSAEINGPRAVALDTGGNVYVADTTRVRKVSPTGTITTIAGSGSSGYSGDGGPAVFAQLSWVAGLAVDAAGNLYVADGFNSRIRKVDPTGTITTIAGNGTAGFSGDGGPATSAELNSPGGLALDGAGNLYISDTGNNRIRKLTPGGTITTFAGNGSPCPTSSSGGDGSLATSAPLCPSGLTLDGAGNLYFAESLAWRVRKIDTTGTLSTPATVGASNSPFGVAVDTSGNLYVADVCKVQVVGPSGGVTTIAGSAAACGYSGDGAPATLGLMGDAYAIAVVGTPGIGP